MRRDRVLEPAGIEVRCDVVTHSGSVVRLAIFPDGRLLLVRGYRHAVDEYLREWSRGAANRVRRRSRRLRRGPY